MPTAVDVPGKWPLKVLGLLVLAMGLGFIYLGLDTARTVFTWIGSAFSIVGLLVVLLALFVPSLLTVITRLMQPDLYMELEGEWVEELLEHLKSIIGKIQAARRGAGAEALEIKAEQCETLRLLGRHLEEISHRVEIPYMPDQVAERLLTVQIADAIEDLEC